MSSLCCTRIKTMLTVWNVHWMVECLPASMASAFLVLFAFSGIAIENQGVVRFCVLIKSLEGCDDRPKRHIMDESGRKVVSIMTS